MSQGKLQRYFFAVANEPFCIWGWNLQERNLHFLREIDHEYFQYLAKVHSKQLDGENKARAAIALRTAYYHGLETLFSLIFAALQSPRCPLAWILKAQPWQVRCLVRKVTTRSYPGPLRFNLERPSWAEVSALIHKLVFHELPSREKMQTKFAEVWQRFANEYTDQFLVDEYNSFKHGFRTHLGGMKVLFAPGGNPSKVPDPDKFISLGESKLGSFFSVPERIVGSPPTKKRDGDPHFWLKEYHVNSHPVQTDLALILISVSINNVRAFLRIINNDRKNPEIRILCPEKEKAFETPWQDRTSLLNFTTNQRVVENQIERLSKKEIMSRLRSERDKS
jgi:hypothetical protein